MYAASPVFLDACESLAHGGFTDISVDKKRGVSRAAEVL